MCVEGNHDARFPNPHTSQPEWSDAIPTRRDVKDTSVQYTRKPLHLPVLAFLKITSLLYFQSRVTSNLKC